MKPWSAVRCLMAAGLVWAGGCAAPSNRPPWTWLSSARFGTQTSAADDEKTVRHNPFGKKSPGAADDEANAALAEGSERSSQPAADPRLEQFDAETARFIEQELAGADEADRNEWLDNLDGQDASMVRALLKIRRAGLLMAQKSKDQAGRATLGGKGENASERGPTALSQAGVLPGAGHSSGRTPPPASPPRPGAVQRGLGLTAWDSGFDVQQASAEGTAAELTAPHSQSLGGQPPAPGQSAGTVAGVGPWSGGVQPAAHQQALHSQTAGTRDSHVRHAIGQQRTPNGEPIGGDAAVVAGRPVHQMSYAPDESPMAGPHSLPFSNLPSMLGTPAEPGGKARVRSGAAAANPAEMVVPGLGASPDSPAASWHEHLERLIDAYAQEVSQTPVGGTPAEREDYIEKHVNLRMLYLMAGQQERAVEAIPKLDPAQQEFWQQVFWAMAAYFDAEAMPNDVDRVTETVAQMRAAVLRLQEHARLEIRNVAFCHKIASFGNYERFDRDEFSSGQPVLLYSEVRNFKSEPTVDRNYRTILKSTVEIYKAGSGDLVERIEFPATEDLCRNQRRDYFHSYEFTVPRRASLGPHVLKLTVEDQLSQKLATYTLNFVVK